MRGLMTLIVVAGVALGLAACQPSSDCGRVLTQDTTLQSDVLNCPGDGLVIGADGIEVRLAGHTVDGVGAAGSAGIRVAGHDGVVVRGPGLVKEFDDGVRVEGGTGNRVRDVEVTLNGVGIHLVEADGGRVVGNDVSENRGPTDGENRGVLLEDSDGNLLSGNTVVEDDASGIELRRSHGNRVVDNAANRADGSNIQLVQSNDNEVVGNNVVSSNNDAILLGGSRRNLVAENEIGGTSANGIFLSASSENRIVRNRGDRNDGDAIELNGSSSGNLVEGNVATRYGDAGIRVGSVTGTAVGNRVRFNELVGGDFFSSDLEDGIYVSSSASQTVVRGNTANDNGDDGIDVDSASTTLRDNVANDNDDLGLEAVAGVTDGAGNRASGNGNPAQCTGVACS
jgi:parallel beta-helix repeat protein